MDPKMDSGMNAKNVKTLEEAIEVNCLPKELTPQQIIGVMDRLFVLEASIKKKKNLGNIGAVLFA